MSSDGASGKPRSSRPARGEDRGVAGIALALLLVLAIVATIVMVFTDNPVWMRIGTLAALWAAFIGAFLVARYRRQAASESARVRDLHTVYELQLEREISARREHELVVEKDLRDNIRAETSDSIHSLRREIAALREQLGQLGVTIPEDRFAVGAGAGAAAGAATGELGTGQSLPSVPSERVEPRRRAPESAASGAAASGSTDAEFGSGSVGTVGAESSATGVRRDATPSTERTEKLSPVDGSEQPAGEADAERPRGPAVRPATRPQPAVDSRSAPEPSGWSAPAEPSGQPAERTGQSPDPVQVPAEPTRAADAASAASSREEPTPPSTTSRHGEEGGLTVAELMARLGGGSDTPTGGHRRRRAED